MKCCYAILLLLFVAGCTDSGRYEFQGYAEGEYVYVSAPVSGKLEKLYVSKGQQVEKGTLLCELESEPEKNAVKSAEQNKANAAALLEDMKRGKRPEEMAMAKAALNQALAEAENAEKLLKRNEELARNGAISKQDLDNYRANAKVSREKAEELSNQVLVYALPERENKILAQEALVKDAHIRLMQAQWDLEQKKLFAPESAFVFDTLYSAGEWVPAGNPVVWLLPDENGVKITFFVPRAVLGQLKYGKRVFFETDGEKEYPAKITYVSPSAEYTPPVIYSNDTKDKLVYMAEAYPEQKSSFLRPGQPVRVFVPKE